MLRTKRFRGAISLLCALCIVFSLYGNRLPAYAEGKETLPGDSFTQEAAAENEPGPAAGETVPQAAEKTTDDKADLPPEEDAAPSEGETADDAEDAQKPFSELDTAGTGESGENAQLTDEAPAAEAELTPDGDEAEPVGEETKEDAERGASDELWNDVPILGSASKDGVTVSVAAPEQSFPKGTSVKVDALGAEESGVLLAALGAGEATVGFDISFLAPDGQRVQPREGRFVDVCFTVYGNSVLADNDAAGAALHVYHIAGNGSAERLASVAAPVRDAVQLSIRANAFSPYILVKETPVKEAPPAAVRGSRAGTVSTNLTDFLVSVQIDAPLDEQGNYIVNPNSSYEMTLQFSESENLQFADEETLTYNFPDGVVVGDLGPATFTLDLTDQYGPTTVSGSYEVVNGQLRVRFNQDDPNFERLKAAPNANFNITIASSFTQSAGEIEFAPGIVKEFVFDDSADVNITKSVVYDMDTDTASYVLQVSSAGLNENVVIEDRLTGTALIFNRDVTVESNIHGALSAVPDYISVENGFRVSIPQMANGEILTLRYTATVDNDKITGTGTVAQTNNTARVTSDQVPEGKEANADFHGDVAFHQVNKSRVGEPVLLDDGSYEATWLVRVNEDHKLTVGGKEIRDWIGGASQPFMQFGGEGLSVEVRFEDGSTETRTIPWSELTTTTNDKGIISWSYTPPVSDGKAAYQITCKTIIDPTGALGNLNVTNYALFHGKETSANQTVQVVTGDGLLIRKEAVGTSDTESEWKLTVTVPGSGLPDLRVVDDFPRVAYDGNTYYDGFVDGSMSVTGLLPGEAWNLYVGSSGHSYTVTFYQDAGQSVPGILPSPDGQPREIEIRFKTSVNQDWLTLAVEDEYQDYRLYAHYNHANARSLDYRTPDAEAYVVPIRPDFVKSFVERADVEIDGVTYPVFRYTLGMYGPLEDGITIHDAFDTSYLRFYEDDGIQIFGGNSLSPTNNNGTISVTETADGMDILVSSFPKTSSGHIYPYYAIEYTLIVRDAAALAALNEAAALSQNGIELENTANWGELESSSKVTYSYFPYVDKELLDRPSSDNGYVAEFKVIINKYAADLDPGSDVLAIRDILSDNLRFLPDSLVISPAVDSIEVQHDPDTNTLTFLNVPDEMMFEIRYRARVLGQGNTTYSNTIQFGKYEKTIEESAIVESSGGGSASNPSITLVKRDADSISTTLAGATFQLYYLQDGGMVPVVDRNGSEVLFTTGADGSVLIVGNQQTLGWALWAGRTYCLLEVSAPTGYELNQEPAYFVLSETPSSQIEYDISGDQFSVQDTLLRTSVSAVKEWIGPAAGSVTVNLLAGTTQIAQATLSAENNWQHTFPDLPKYDNGVEIVYRIEELDLPGYSSEIIPNGDGSYTIVNTNIETIDIPVTKQWVGPAVESVTVKLLADGVLIDTAELTAAGDWQHTFADLPKYDSVDGHEIVYDVSEDPLAGYDPGRSGTVETGFTFTNTITGRVSIPVTKQWVGPAAGSVTVNLLAGTTQIAQATLSAENNWQHTFPDLPKYDNGVEIVYRIEELDLPGYSSEIIPNGDGSYTIVNTNIETLDIPVTKQWVGEPADAVTVRLTADGERIDMAELNEAGGWQHTFTDLPKYDSTDGHEIVYDVSEDPVDGYDPGRSGTVETGFTFTNTITGKVSIPVTKRWIGPAARSVTVELLADTTKVAQATLSAENNWQYTFTDFPKYDSTDGHEIVYRIEEVEIGNYSSGITGDMSGYTITNTNTSTRNISVEKRWEGAPLSAVTVRLFADGKEIDHVTLRADQSWKHTFANLPRFDPGDGHEIVYTVSEDAVSGYTLSIKGNAGDGFVITNTKKAPPPPDDPKPPHNRPKTGDNSRLLPYLVTMLISGSGFLCAGVGLNSIRRKNKR